MLVDTIQGCQHIPCYTLVSGNKHLNKNTQHVHVKWMQISPPLQYTFKLFNSRKTPLHSKQYTHECEFLSSYMIIKAAPAGTEWKQLSMERGTTTPLLTSTAV